MVFRAVQIVVREYKHELIISNRLCPAFCFRRRVFAEHGPDLHFVLVHRNVCICGRAKVDQPPLPTQTLID